MCDLSVSLEVKERNSESVECWMCTSDTTIFKTVVEFTANGNDLGGMVLCVEHMDGIVTAAMKRHEAELLVKNPRWYEKSDESFDDEHEWLLNEGWKR